MKKLSQVQTRFPPAAQGWSVGRACPGQALCGAPSVDHSHPTPHTPTALSAPGAKTPAGLCGMSMTPTGLPYNGHSAVLGGFSDPLPHLGLNHSSKITPLETPWLWPNPLPIVQAGRLSPREQKDLPGPCSQGQTMSTRPGNSRPNSASTQEGSGSPSPAP